MTPKESITRQQVTLSSPWLSRTRQLYEEAFPEEERIPFDELMRLVEEMPLDFTGYFVGNRFLGFTIVYPHERFNWFWYFAVEPAERGRGYGQQILSNLISRYEDGTCILDMESPRQESDNTAQRMRRLAFYERNGFRDTNVERSYEGITYTIMIRGEGMFTRDDYDEIISSLWRHWQP